MNTSQKKPRKVRTTLSITKQAQDIIFDHGYASERTQGEFISAVIVEYHARRGRKLKTAEIAAQIAQLAAQIGDLTEELHRLVDLLAERAPTDSA
jgi:hypothetical protein